MAESSDLHCEIFEAEVGLGGSPGRPEIHYKLWTDLPAGTLMALSCYRSYLSWRNERAVWVMAEDELIVRPNVLGDFNGAQGVISVEKADLHAKKEFEQRLKSGFSAGIQTPVGDEVELIFTVGARQRLKAFGKNNRNLAGPLVQEEGGVRFVELRKKVKVPLRSDLQPLREEGEDES